MNYGEERAIRATRAVHHCQGCDQEISAGSTAVRWSGLSDGGFMSVIYHPDCRQAEIMLNERNDRGPDEWFDLSAWNQEDELWLSEKFPDVAARLGITNKPPRAQPRHGQTT
jgi:hypothetical protein